MIWESVIYPLLTYPKIMSDFSDIPKVSRFAYRQPLKRQTICNDCAFHTLSKNKLQCTHPDELKVNCSSVIFCNSFQPMQEVDSPCVSFDDEE